MPKTSEVIDLARNDPRYLNEQPYLCYILSYLTREDKITISEYASAAESIMESIGGFVLLRTWLRNAGTIEHLEDERHPSYRHAANDHWDKLIAQLQAVGD